MRVLNIRQAADFLREDLGMHHVTLAWVRKQAEPDAHGRRRLPFGKHGTGRTSRLVTTDDALRAFYADLVSRVHLITNR